MRVIIVIIFILLSINLYSNINQLPGWPQKINELNWSIVPVRGVGVININDDPYLEIVLGINNDVYCFDYQGNIIWQTYTEGLIQAPLCYSDIDNDGYLEIIRLSRFGNLHILDKDGNYYQDFPLHFDSNYSIGAPLAYDFNNDGIKEIVFSTIIQNVGTYLHIIDLEGNYISSNLPFFIETGQYTPVIYTPAIGDINDDGQADIVFISSEKIYAIDCTGNLLPGWPKLPFNGQSIFNLNAPVLADINNDGYLEIISSCAGGSLNQISGLTVYNYLGDILPGFPVKFNFGGSNCTPTIADLDNDGSLEIICGDDASYPGYNSLYVLNADGTYYSNSPYYSRGGIISSIIGNIDDTQEKEIVYDDCSSIYEKQPLRGFLRAVNPAGCIPEGFPLRPIGVTGYHGLAFGDVNQDGLIDLISLSSSNDTMYINVYGLDKEYDRSEIEWLTFHYDHRRLGEYLPPFSFEEPQNLIGELVEDSIYLYWQPPPNKRNYAYNIYRNEELIKRIADTTYIDTELQSYYCYEYYVTSVYEQGYSDSSNHIIIYTDSVSVEDDEIILGEFNFLNYPNPFNPETKIAYQLPIASNVEIHIYNIKGERVKTLVDECKSAGYHNVIWNGKDDSGKEVSSGIYFYKMITDEHTSSKKMLLLR